MDDQNKRIDELEEQLTEAAKPWTKKLAEAAKAWCQNLKNWFTVGI